MKLVCLEPRRLKLLFLQVPLARPQPTEGCDIDTGNRNEQLCQAPLRGLPAELRPHRKLEHKPQSATSTDHRVPRNRKGRSRAFTGERSQCPPDTPSQHCEGNITEAGDELCFRARVSGINSGLAYITRLPRPSHTLSLAAVGRPDHKIP